MKTSKNQNPDLNPYHIYWGVVEITEGKLTKSQQNNIARVSGSSIGERDHLLFHGSEDKIDERMQNVLENLIVSGVHGRMYKITDKQYGMIQNSWNGTIPECPKPFTKQLILKVGTMTSVVPLSEEQVSESIEF